MNLVGFMITLLLNEELNFNIQQLHYQENRITTKAAYDSKLIHWFINSRLSNLLVGEIQYEFDHES